MTRDSFGRCDARTLDRYVQTQLLDFVLIAIIVFFGLAVSTLAARLNPPRSIFARAARAA